MNKVGYLEVYRRTGLADTDGHNHLMIYDEYENDYDLYGQDIIDYIDFCYYTGILTISGAKPIGRYEVTDPSDYSTVKGIVYVTYDPTAGKNVDSYVTIEKPSYAAT